jgi:NAD(P)H dehydrogenase (quinone)
MYVVTGATGKLGSLVVRGLLAHVPASEVAVVVRNAEHGRQMVARGVEARVADYAQPVTLERAFASGDRVLFVSSSAVNERQTQHANVVRAAAAAGAAFLAYTSTLHASTSKMGLAIEHYETEQMVVASGIPHAFLRNGWYLENYTEHLQLALSRGVMLGAAGDGRVAAASRADFAAAAVAVLLDARFDGATLELAGDEAFTMDELAAEVTRQSGHPIAYENRSAADYEKALLGFGMRAPIASLLADTDEAIARGEMDDRSKTLSRVIGRATTTLAAAVGDALAMARGAKSAGIGP